MENHEIILGDSRNMEELEDESVSMAVTSPPYVTTKMEEDQKFAYEDHLELCTEVFQEVYRALIPDGKFILNVGDIYTKYLHEDDKLHKAPLAMDTCNAAREVGFRQFDQIIWDKGFTRNFGGPLLGTYPYPTSMFFNNYFEFIFVLRKPGKRPSKSQEQREKSEISKEKWKKYMQNWWRIESVTEKFDGHKAVFPVELPKRTIELYSFKGDRILDPFAGSCTTAQAAELTGRKSICYEIDSDLKPIIEKRVSPKQQKLFGEIQYSITEREDASPGMSQMTGKEDEEEENETEREEMKT